MPEEWAWLLQAPSVNKWPTTNQPDNSSPNKALIKEKLELQVLIKATEKCLDSLVVRLTAGGQNRMIIVSYLSLA